MNMSFETQRVFIEGLIDAIYFVGGMIFLNALVNLLAIVFRRR